MKSNESGQVRPGEVKSMTMPEEFTDLKNQLGDIPLEVDENFLKLDFESQMKKINRVHFCHLFLFIFVCIHI